MFGEIQGEEYMAKLSEFIGAISKQQLARKAQYKVKIFGPKNKSADANLNLLCESIAFPGQNIRSVPDTLRYGPAREHGQGITYGPFTATFVCSSDLREKKYFEWWQRQIINQNTWEVKYYDNYKGSLEISQLDVNDNETYKIKVTEAYPKTILAQDVGYAQVNAYQTIGIEFTYRFWQDDHWNKTALASSSQGNLIQGMDTVETYFGE